MNWWLLFPLIAALMGWLIVSAGLWFMFKRILPKRKEALAGTLSTIMVARLLPAEEITEKFASPDSFQKLLPSIEVHIDEFLRHKLGKSMPFLSMFVGDKTINQLKELFMEELALIFPVVMKKYIAGLQQEMNLEDVLKARLAAIPPEKIEASVKELFARELRLIKMTGALIGLIIGLIQGMMLYLISQPLIK